MTKLNKKRILLVGGLGEIGQILANGLNNKYDLLIADLPEKPNEIDINYIQVDVTNYFELVKAISMQVDVLINLIGVPEQSEIVDAETMSRMADVYLKGTYNLFFAATELGIPKVIFASSNHVTDHYESQGRSLLNHEISCEDYPLSRSVYGALKLAGESIGHAFSVNKGLSVICLRIGTVRMNEREALISSDRFKRTLLSKTDLVNLINCSVEASIDFGIYYGVSNNPGKPWSMRNAALELGFESKVNSRDLL